MDKKLTESEILKTIDKVVKRLAYKFRFAYHTLEDIEQEGRIIAWQAMEYYDYERPLENFLWRVIRNGLFNFKRDNYTRPNKPCEKCEWVCTKEGQEECELYLNWIERNKARRNILNPIDLDSVSDEKEHSMHVVDLIEERVERKEVLDIIGQQIPIEMRADWLKLLRGIHVPKVRREELEKTVNEIAGVENGESWTTE